MPIEQDRAILYDPPTNDLAPSTTGTDLSLTGDLDVDGTITAGSGNHQLTNAAGLMDPAKVQPGSNNTAFVTDSGGVPGFGPVTNTMLGYDVYRRQRVKNGGMELWQRGAGPFTASTNYTADGWKIALAGSSTISVSRNSANAATNSKYCMAATYVHNTASAIQNKIEDYQQLRGETLTVTAKVACDTASAVRLSIWDDVTGHTYSWSYHTGGGTYETLEATATIASNATAVVISTWFEASCTAYIDNIMGVVGWAGMTYQPMHPAEELALMQRYFEILCSGSSFVGPTGQIDLNTGPFRAYFPWLFNVEKATTPTINISGAADLGAYYATGGDTGAATSASAFGTTTRMTTLNIQKSTGSYGTSGHAAVLHGVTASAVVSAEANP